MATMSTSVDIRQLFARLFAWFHRAPHEPEPRDDRSTQMDDRALHELNQAMKRAEQVRHASERYIGEVPEPEWLPGSAPVTGDIFSMDRRRQQERQRTRRSLHPRRVR